jgi:hypothetical protein
LTRIDLRPHKSRARKIRMNRRRLRPDYSIQLLQTVVVFRQPEADQDLENIRPGVWKQVRSDRPL